MKLRLRATRALVLPAIVLALVTHHVYAEGSLADTLIGGAGLVFLTAAAAGRIWASAYVIGRKNRSLVMEGPFSIVRNPLYFCSFLAFVGAGLSFGSLALAAVFALTFFATHWPTIHAEERNLEEIFGEAYRAYRSRVPRFIPAVRRPDPGSALEADPRLFAKALMECTLIPLLFVIAELVNLAKVEGILPILLRLP
jgi:protein-S-isoprenylcysteine O-methyltransferase Ste14